jgi:hypothetical protein
LAQFISKNKGWVMTLQQRINDLNHLGNYIKTNSEEWQNVKDLAYRKNQWFAPLFIDLSSNNIADSFLQRDKLDAWASQYWMHGQVNII